MDIPQCKWQALMLNSHAGFFHITGCLRRELLVSDNNTTLLFRNTLKSNQQKSWVWRSLTHWGWGTHICISKLTIIGSDNGLSSDWCQAIIWTNAGILLIGPLGTNFNEIIVQIHAFSFKKMHLKMAAILSRPQYVKLQKKSMCPKASTIMMDAKKNCVNLVQAWQVYPSIWADCTRHVCCSLITPVAVVSWTRQLFHLGTALTREYKQNSKQQMIITLKGSILHGKFCWPWWNILSDQSKHIQGLCSQYNELIEAYMRH